MKTSDLTPAQQATAEALDRANDAFGKIQEIGEADPLYAVKKKAAMATRRVRRKEWEATWPETNTPELHHEIRECRNLQALALNELALAEYNATFPAK